MKYMVWGYGWESQRLLELGFLQAENIVAFIDVRKVGMTESGIKIVSPQQGLTMLNKADRVLIPVRHDVVKREIYAQALTLGYRDEKLLFLYNTCDFAKVHEQVDADLEKIAAGLSVEKRKQDQQLAMDLVRPFMPFVSLEFDGLRFIFASEDEIITHSMVQDQATFPKAEMEFCLRKCQEIGMTMEKGIFLEVGANVGTTTLYMHKRLGKTWKYYAFEPMEENFKLLQVNCLLNGCQDIVCENKGITDHTGGQMRFLFDEYNSGGSGVDIKSRRQSPHMVNPRMVSCTTVDDYLAVKAISYQNVRLIWIDVQGHEPNVVAGAKKTLRSSGAPCYLEFNYQDYEELGTLRDFVQDLQTIYDKFICYEQYENGRTTARPVSELDQLADELRDCVPFGNIFLWKDGT